MNTNKLLNAVEALLNYKNEITFLISALFIDRMYYFLIKTADILAISHKMMHTISNAWDTVRTLVQNNFLTSQPKHMLWVLK